jgi:SAM-dependent methyltransferase
VTNSVFNAYSRYYNLLYSDKDYFSEVAYIHGLLTINGVNQGSLLEFGSGTGGHGRLLAAKGYTVHGIELSAEMVAHAQICSGFTCQQGDITTINMGRQYDAVLSLFHVISYQTKNKQILDVFTNAALHLNCGGVFIFDFWYSPAVYYHKPSLRVKRMKDAQTIITRIAEPTIFPNENRVDVTYTIFDECIEDKSYQVLVETHSMRHFSIPEIHMLASSVGFEVISAEEFLTGNPPSEFTWGVCMVLRKMSFK